MYIQFIIIILIVFLISKRENFNPQTEPIDYETDRIKTENIKLIDHINSLNTNEIKLNSGVITNGNVDDFNTKDLGFYSREGEIELNHPITFSDFGVQMKKGLVISCNSVLPNNFTSLAGNDNDLNGLQIFKDTAEGKWPIFDTNDKHTVFRSEVNARKVDISSSIKLGDQQIDQKLVKLLNGSGKFHLKQDNDYIRCNINGIFSASSEPCGSVIGEAHEKTDLTLSR